MGRSVAFSFPPKRIVSLVPSQTELLASLGLDAEVVGITKFCIEPNDWYRNKTRVGGTKDFKQEIIRQLNPDLILGNKEENDQQRIEELAEEFPVWMSDIHSLADAIDMIQAIGSVCDRNQQAQILVQNIQERFNKLQGFNPKKVAYLIWHNPMMVAGNHTFINTMLNVLGLKNSFAQKGRYPEVSEQELRDAAPDLIFLSSEPFPFKEKHIDYYREICPSAVIKLVDGMAFSWYGSRLLESPVYFESLRKSLES